jgi:hypothetical protein
VVEKPFGTDLASSRELDSALMAVFTEDQVYRIAPMAFYEVVMNEAFRRLVDGGVDVSVDTGLRAAEKLQALIDARAGEADMASMRVEIGRIIEVVRTFIPSERWPEVQAALRGDTSIQRQQQSSPVGGVRMVAIDDTPDQDGY